MIATFTNQVSGEPGAAHGSGSNGAERVVGR
jgi:hypothetical protein